MLNESSLIEPEQNDAYFITEGSTIIEDQKKRGQKVVFLKKNLLNNRDDPYSMRAAINDNDEIKHQASYQSSIGEGFDRNSDGQIRTPDSKMNIGINLPKIDIKKVTEGGRSKSLVRGTNLKGIQEYLHNRRDT